MATPYYGKGLRINLTSKSIFTETLDPFIYDTFLGGKGIGAYLLLNHLPAQAEPLGAQNILIFLTGPFTGSTFPSSARSVVVTKSPLTGTFLDSNVGGHLGKALESSGYDFLMIEGASDVPVWIDIKDQEIRFNDASRIWGLSTIQTEASLRKELEDQGAQIISIGPAGEKKVLFASISCGGRMFGRGGAGAVMGSKNLKAIAVNGSHRRLAYQAKSFLKEVKSARKKIQSNLLTSRGGAFPLYGTTFTTEVTQKAGVLPTRNWQESVFEKANRLFGDVFVERKKKSLTCFQCPIGCSRIVETADGSKIRTEGPEYETIYAFGSNCGIDDPDTIIKADLLCEEYGLDTISCGVVIGFFMECCERELLNGRSGGVDIRFGDSDGLLEMIRLIGDQTGIGKHLGRGVMRFSNEIGPETERFAMCVKGLELPGYDPRGIKGMALLYATSDRGGCHVRGSTLRAELLGLPEPMDRFGYEGKAAIAVELQRVYTIMGVLSQCLFANFALTIHDYAAGLSALLGKSIVAGDLLVIGKRIWDVTRHFNCREGFDRKDDTLPSRLFEDSVPSGPSKGQVVDRDAFESMKDEYYRLQGWDIATGTPKAGVTEIG